jgi:hypothetical protein
MSRAASGPTTVAFCLVALAGALVETQRLQARNLLEKGLAFQEGLGIETATLVTQATLISAAIGDWPLTLRLAERSVRHQQWLGQVPYLAGTLNIVARAVAATDVETAARLQGAARHLAPQPTAGITAIPGRTNPASPAVAPPARR